MTSQVKKFTPLHAPLFQSKLALITLNLNAIVTHSLILMLLYKLSGSIRLIAIQQMSA